MTFCSAVTLGAISNHAHTYLSSRTAQGQGPRPRTTTLHHRQPHCPLTPPPRNPANIHIFLTFLETRTIDLHFDADTMGLSLFDFFSQRCVSAVKGHPRTSILVRVESTYATSCQSVLVLRCTISEILQVFFAHGSTPIPP